MLYLSHGGLGLTLFMSLHTIAIQVIMNFFIKKNRAAMVDLNRQDSYNTVAAAIMTLLSPLWTAVLAFLSLMANPKNGYKIILITNKHPYL